MSVAKSIRIPKEIYKYIDNYNGDGFNQKFCNIIRDAMKTEEERKLRISMLDNLIGHREDYLRETEKELLKISNQLREMYLDIQCGFH